MFQLLYPLGLLAAFGITIPILIHLWNVKSGKTLKIGSVFLLGTPSNQRSRSLKIQDWPLLLLRCLLIFLIAFLLARPVYQTLIKSNSSAGWVLVKKAAFSKLWKEQPHLLDSLVKKGYEIHDFDVSFQKIELKDSLSNYSRSANNNLSYFSLVKQLDDLHAPGTTMYIFTGNELKDFNGQKPETHLNINWYFSQADSLNKSWPAFAFQMPSGKTKQLSGQATPLGTYYKTAALSDATIDIKVDTATKIIQVYADKNSPDAAYVSSAVMAAADFTERKIKLQRIYAAKEVSTNADLVFWLSEQQLNLEQKSRLSKAKAYFTYAIGKLKKYNSRMTDLSGISPQAANIYRYIEPSQDSLTSVWVDDFGQTLLGKTASKSSLHYEFFSRFRPEWTDLVWSDQMASYLLPILLPEAEALMGFQDIKKLPIQQDKLALNKISKAIEKPIVKHKEASLSPWVWWTIILVFLMERWISYRKNLTNT